MVFVDASIRIGFTAGATSDSSSWNSGTLVFPKVITNVGNGYNPSDGIFTAPIVGLYVFFVNVQSYASHEIWVDIVLNGNSKVRGMANTDNWQNFETASNLAVLSLQKGDRVWVEHALGKGYFSLSVVLTTFSGFLV